jgi:hypothetical protein
VECAQQNGYLLGFEVTPVKGSRRDQHSIVNINGETGVMSAAIWCKEHIPTRNLVHRMHDQVVPPDGETGTAASTALQLFVQTFKQADLKLTGTVRKANLVSLATKTSVPPTTHAHRRQSTTATTGAGSTAQRSSSLDHHSDSASVIPPSVEQVCITCGIDVSPKWYPIDKDQEKILVNGHHGTLGSEAKKFVAQRSVQCFKCKKTNRKPVPHSPEPVEEPRPTETVSRPPPPYAPPLASSPTHVSHAVNRLTDLSSVSGHGSTAWAGRGPAPAAASAAPAPAPAAPVSTTPLHPPSAAPPPSSLPLASPHAGLSPMAAPLPPHLYAPPTTPYNEWHRTPTQHTAPAHQINGASTPASSHHHNHLRDLRPPPIPPISHHQPTPLQHGLGQPMVNGIPPSPPRRGPPSVQPGSAPFMSSYPPHHSLQNLTNGGPPPRAAEHSFSQGMLPQRSPFSTPHGSPPVSRDGIPMSREPSLSNNAPPRPNDGRPTSGASASPSLRNLLS